jgi:hypothetical protein
MKDNEIYQKQRRKIIKELKDNLDNDSLKENSQTIKKLHLAPLHMLDMDKYYKWQKLDEQIRNFHNNTFKQQLLDSDFDIPNAKTNPDDFPDDFKRMSDCYVIKEDLGDTLSVQEQIFKVMHGNRYQTQSYLDPLLSHNNHSSF